MERLRTKDIKDIINLGDVGSFTTFRNNIKHKFKLKEEDLNKKEFSYDKYIWKFYRLFKNTYLLREEVYSHVVDKKTYEEVIQLYDNITIKSFRSIIYRDVKRVSELITINPLEVVKNKIPLTEDIESEINTLLEMYPENREGVVNLNIDFSKSKYDIYFNEELKDEDFKQIIELLKYKSVKYQELIDRSLSAEVLGYVEYLLTIRETNLTSKELYRKELLQTELLL